MWIQLLLIAAIIVVAVLLLRRSGGDRHLAIRRLILLGFVAIAIVSVLFPQWLSWVANLMGVGRGTDLVLYALVVVFLLFVSTQYRRNVQQERKITQLSRRIALIEAEMAVSTQDAASSDSND